MSFQMMARDRVVPSPLNPRKHFDEAKLQELAASMANGVGIIEPLVVRSRPDLNCYELIAGERRWRAAAIAGLDELPVVVKELTDAQVIEQMLIENGQREDVNDIEEGEGYKQALRLGAFADVGALAAHVGKSRRYVYDHLKLVDDLVPEARELVLRGEISGSHGVILSRLTPEQQAVALDPDDGGLFMDDPDVDPLEVDADVIPSMPRSVREFESWVARRFRFDPAAKVNRELFPETVAAIEAAEKVVQITHEDYLAGAAKDEAVGRILTRTKWARADGLMGSTACDSTVTGVIVIGPGRGTAFPVCVAKTCPVHMPSESGAAGTKKASSPKMAYAKTGAYVPVSKLEEENRKYEAQRAREQAEREAFKLAQPSIVKACAALVQKMKPAALLDVVVEAREVVRNYVDDALRLLPKRADAGAVLQALALAALIGQCDDEWYAPSTFPAVAKRIGLDLKPLLKAVQTSAPAAESTPAAVGQTKGKGGVKAKGTVKKKAVAVSKDLKKKAKAS